MRFFLFCFSLNLIRLTLSKKKKIFLTRKALALMEGKILAIFLGEIGMTAGNSSKKNYIL